MSFLMEQLEAKERERERIKNSTRIVGERKFYGIAFNRDGTSIIESQVVFKKPRGQESFYKSEEIPMGIISQLNYFIDAPRILEITSVIFKERWRPDEIFKDSKKIVDSGHVIFCSPAPYYTQTVRSLPNIQIDEIVAFEGEREQLTDTTKALVSEGKINIKTPQFNWEYPSDIASLLQITKNLIPFLLVENYLVDSYYIPRRIKGR